MTKSFIVILEDDIDSQGIVNAIKQINGVVNVKPLSSDEVAIRVTTSLWEKVDQIFKDELNEDVEKG